PRLPALMVAKTAPPPSTADIRASNCEMLTNEPTTSSGDGMAKACPVPSRQSASAANIDVKEKAAASTTRRTQPRVRIYEFPQVGVANNQGRSPQRVFGSEQREMCRISH